MLPLYPEEFKREFILIYHRNKYLTPAIKSLIGLICEEKRKADILKQIFKFIGEELCHQSVY